MTANHVLNTINQISKSLEKLAEVTSPCPDLPERLWTRDGYPRTAKQAQALLVILPMVSKGTRNVDLYLDLVEHIRNMAINYGNQEAWKIVIETLHNYHSKPPATIIENTMSTMSNEDWYGNMIPELKKAIRSIKKQRLDYSVVSDIRPFTKKQRKRGYDDKGTYQIDPWPRTPVPDKEKVAVEIPDPPLYRLWNRFRQSRGR